MRILRLLPFDAFKRSFIFYVITFLCISTSIRGIAQARLIEGNIAPPQVCSIPESDTSGTTADFIFLNDIRCDSNIFYSVTATGEIDRLRLINGNIVFDTIEINSSNSRCLAICDNLNGGSVTPTFYADDYFTTNNAPTYWNFSGWVTVPNNYPDQLNNAGGYGNFLFYIGYPSNQRKDIVRYDGSSFSIIYHCDTNSSICVSDLAVDSIGNVYFLKTNSLWGTVSDSLIVLSPNGQVVSSHAFSIDCSNHYGALMMNGLYYLAFGPNNPTFPNMLVPVYMTSSTVFAGTPITNPYSNFTTYDLASCSPGIPTAIRNVEQHRSAVQVYPNPNNGIFTIHFGHDIYSDSLFLNMYDITGKLIESIPFTTQLGQADISVQGLQSGVYVYRIDSGEAEIANGRLVIIE